MDFLIEHLEQVRNLLSAYPLLAAALAVCGLLFLAWIINWITKRILLHGIGRWLCALSSGDSADLPCRLSIISHLANIVPALVVSSGAAMIPGIPLTLLTIIRNVCAAFIVLSAALALGEILNLADIVETEFDNDAVKYIRKKTASKKEGDKIVSFTIPDDAKPIIRKYIKRNGKLDFGYKFSYRNFQRYVNYCLKDLASKLGIASNVSFYSARKTFAQFAFDLGIRTEVIEYCLGQSMKENRPIYNYVRVMHRQADAAIRMVIDYTNNPDKYKLGVLIG